LRCAAHACHREIERLRAIAQKMGEKRCRPSRSSSSSRWRRTIAGSCTWRSPRCPDVRG